MSDGTFLWQHSMDDDDGMMAMEDMYFFGVETCYVLRERSLIAFWMAFGPD